MAHNLQIISMDEYFDSILSRLGRIGDGDCLDDQELLREADAYREKLISGKKRMSSKLKAISMKNEMVYIFSKEAKRRSRCRLYISNSYIECHDKDRLDFYKLFLIFMIGSMLGVAMELIWCFMRHGHFESRQGLIYGPFNPLYGIAAVMLTLLLHRYRFRYWYKAFFISLISGSLLEYTLSFAQEKLFGSVSWDYSAMSLNIGGRVSLVYSVFWGLLGVLWIKVLYPYISYFINKIPFSVKKVAVIALLIFMLLNAVVSLAAVYRWSNRIDGESKDTKIEYFLDKHFPDERMKRIYPNMVW